MPEHEEPWDVALTKAVVRAIVRYKDAAGWTTAQLAARVGDVLGETVTVPALNNLFAGRRKTIGIGELLAFAAALGVPPLALLAPLHAPEVRLLPNLTASPLEAAAYFGSWGAYGTEELLGPSTSSAAADDRDVLALVIRHWAALYRIDQVLREVRPVRYTGPIPESFREQRRTELPQAVQEVRDVREIWRQHEVIPPDLGRLAWIDQIDAADVFNMSDDVIVSIAKDYLPDA